MADKSLSVVREYRVLISVITRKVVILHEKVLMPPENVVKRYTNNASYEDEIRLNLLALYSLYLCKHLFS